MSWPWRLNDTRPHGWFTANGLTRYGPLPKREVVEPTWPPRELERNQQKASVARAHIGLDPLRKLGQ